MKMFVLFLFAVIALAAFSQSEWVEIYNANSVSSPDKTYFLDENHIWGVKAGAIFFSNDGGQSWDIQYEKPDNNYSDIYFANETDGWVVGWSEVLHTSNSGANWELQTLPNPLGLDVNTVYFINPDTGWIAGSYKTIFVTYDGGENWSIQLPYQLLDQYWLYEIRFWDELYGCAVGGQLIGGDTGIIFNTQDGGETWIYHLFEASQEFNSVQFVDQNTIWAGDRSGRLYRSIDGGLSWEFVVYFYGQGSPHLNDFHFFNSNSALAILNPYQMATTANAWQEYDVINLGLYHRFQHLSFNIFGKGIASGFGDFWMTLDSGETWYYQNKKFYCLDFPDSGSGWMSTISPDNGFYQTTTGGLNWQQIPIPDEVPVLSIDFITIGDGFISTESGLYRTIDGGTSWQNLPLPAGVTTIRRIQAIDIDFLYALADENKLLKTTDGGQSWEVFEDFETEYLTDLHFIDAQWGSLVGSGGFTATTPDGGINWDYTNVESVYPSAVWFLNQNEGYFITVSDSIYHTLDGGHNWNTGKLKIFRGVDIEFANDSIGWIAEWHKIHKTTDGGKNWITEFAMPGTAVYNDITDIAVVDDQTAYFCTSDGKVFYYDFTSSVNQNRKIEQLHCYPNPTDGIIKFSSDEYFSGREQVVIYDPAGHKVDNFIYYFHSGKMVLDVSDLGRGLYFYKIIEDNLVHYSGKLIVR